MTRLALLLGIAFAITGCSFGDNLTGRSGNSNCGNHVVDPGEGCDDGNTINGDGCSSTCQVETSQPVCGNHVVESGEQCDDGNTVSGDGCSSTCQKESLCGNGHLDPGEQCDDGNTQNGDGCSSTCHTESATACALFPQDGCSSGDACDFTEDDSATACRNVAVAGHASSRCTDLTDCDIGYTCVTDTATVSSCMAFCDVDTDCTGPGARCVIALVDANNNSLNVDVCSVSCGLETGSGCPSGMGCIGIEAGSKDYTDCEVVGSGQEFDSCSDDTDCSPGTSCSVDTNGDAECLAYCEVSDANACGGNGCTEFDTPLKIGTIEWGFCDDF